MLAVSKKTIIVNKSVNLARIKNLSKHITYKDTAANLYIKK